MIAGGRWWSPGGLDCCRGCRWSPSGGWISCRASWAAAPMGPRSLGPVPGFSGLPWVSSAEFRRLPGFPGSLGPVPPTFGRFRAAGLPVVVFVGRFLACRRWFFAWSAAAAFRLLLSWRSVAWILLQFIRIRVRGADPAVWDRGRTVKNWCNGIRVRGAAAGGAQSQTGLVVSVGVQSQTGLEDHESGVQSLTDQVYGRKIKF